MEEFTMCGKSAVVSQPVVKNSFYLLQVDFGGVPARLVNYISKRQPLAIAYLRDYLLGV